MALDLSDAIDVAAALPELRDSTLVQGDLSHLPVPDESLDVVYCEGVLQHTEDIVPILREFARVLAPGGNLLVTHYALPQDVLRRAQWKLRESIRRVARHVPRDALFLASGVGAALSFVPLLGAILRKSVVVANHRMPTLKATWSATYDTYGLHEFQRFLPHEQFKAAVAEAGFRAEDVGEPGVIKATRLPRPLGPGNG